MSDYNKVFQTTMLGNLGQQAGLAAFRFRKYKLAHELQLSDHLQWKQIFPIAEVLVLGLAALALLLVDVLFMMPVYKQISQVISGDKDLLKWPIALFINVLAIVTSEKLAKCATEGAFYRWEIWKHSGNDTEGGIMHLRLTRKQRIIQFLVPMAIYLAVLFTLLWLRSDLIRNAANALEKMEFQMSLLGVLIALFAVTVGVYLMPLLQLLNQLIQMWEIETRLEKQLEKVVELDAYVSKLWQQTGKPTDASQDVKECLVRHQIRSKNIDYCDPVTESELMVFATAAYGNQSPFLPNREAA